MKFKTIVVTKRRLAVFASAAALTAAFSVICAFCVSNEHTEVFGYTGILNEALPVSNQEIGIKDIINNALGFDVGSPETIIGEYSSALDGGSYEDNLAPENGMENVQEEDNSEETAMPAHKRIAAGEGLKLNNATDYDVNLAELCAGELKIKPDSEEPQILVVHTHTTECYLGDEMKGETERNTDDSVNVVAVGEEICKVLDSYGIKTVHDLTYHDYPSYQGSYSRALSTIQARLEEYPSIKAVLDIHRDAFVYSDGSRLRVACDQNGTETAQVMLVVGTNSMGLWHDNWQENLRFAAKIQSAANIMYPELMRPINLRTERFNGHTTLGSLILEVGSNGNTLEEAKEGGRDVAHAIAAALING